ncbi:TonB-dependent receptor [candidate division KSB1 bacterium]|nr:TonB-dependent receptor [candidate division KSB1 bacterium]
MRKCTIRILYIFAISLLSFSAVWSQTTGKISGTITDARTGDPLPGANVIIEGTMMGAATDLNGSFFIINVPPGTYNLLVRVIGYENLKYENIQVSVNRTTTADIKLKPTVIEGEEVVVQADRMVIKKDQTSTVRNVSSEQIEMLPVENIGQVVSMQAGVVDGHFRGGRMTEVAYLVDGIEVTESFGGSGRAVDIEPEAVQDLEVITGTFNAEYGNAMSGIVNAVTKAGQSNFQGSFSANAAEYLTGNDDIFIGLSEFNPVRNQDYKLQLSGPVWGDKITFFTNVRYQDNLNHLYGIRRFEVDDYSNYEADDPELWHTEANGDSDYVSMNGGKNISFMGKLSARLHSNFKVSFLYTLNDDKWQGYNHAFKYNPDGMAAAYRETDLYSFNINHMLSPKLFYELKLSYMDNYYGDYVFEDSTEWDGYVHDAYFSDSGPGFFTGGQQKDHIVRTMIDRSAKFDLTWQMNQNHSFKTGISYVDHDLDSRWSEIRNLYSGQDEEGEFYYDYEQNKTIFPNYTPVIYPDSSIYTDSLSIQPKEFSVYLQDKMEFNEMVINIGIRYDYFNPKTVVPSDRRNPSNQLSLPDSMMSTYPKVKAQTQISPRFGLSYQLGESALLHFSYGHFFQMPPMYALYENNSFRVAPNDYTTTMGNAEIKAEKTVQYEIGLWQEIAENMGLEVALFYRDIYDLLSTRIISTYNQIEYGLYSNKDYGNVKGLEVKYDYRWKHFTTMVNYTLQYTRANADNPTQTFDRAGNSRDPINRLIPLSWDQRHTFNMTVGYNTKDFGMTLTGYYNSGAPYTWSPIGESMLSRVNLYPNNNWRPSRYTVDLSGYYDFRIRDNIRLRFSLNVYNLLDRLNEEWVNAETGRAYTAIIRERDIESHRSDFNTVYDIVQNPSMYSAPRLIKLGIGVVFF